MLVLRMTEKGEKVYIGDDITIEITSAHGKRCRLGITAPKDVKVYRESVYWARKNEAQQGKLFPTETNDRASVYRARKHAEREQHGERGQRLAVVG